MNGNSGLVEVEITGIHRAGYGMGRTDQGARLSLPGTLPGETATVRANDAETAERLGKLLLSADDIVAINRRSPQRVAAPCPYFGRCGGCSLQHWDLAAAGDFKRGQVVDALHKAGFTAAPVAATVLVAPGQRRRVDFAAQRDGAVLRLGLHAQGKKDVIDLDHCPASLPGISALLAPLRACLRGLSALRREASVVINWVDSGADILLRLDGPITADDRKRLAGFAASHAITRISLGHGLVRGRPAPAEILVRHGACRTVFDTTSVELPPGAFLQASADGEAAIRHAVLAGLTSGKIPARPLVIELYAGNGTFSFSIGKIARVRAYEGDDAAVTALNLASGTGQVTATARDLTRQPLQKTDFAGAWAVVLDPPYDGAVAQMAPIAQSDIGRVIYVSCNPTAMTKDLATLSQAGFGVDNAVPVDQFPWTGEIETIVTLTRKIKNRRNF